MPQLFHQLSSMKNLFMFREITIFVYKIEQQSVACRLNRNILYLWIKGNEHFHFQCDCLVWLCFGAIFHQQVI